jgi:CRISPR-associated protein Cmr6
MRDALSGLVEQQRGAKQGPHHAGLAYERYAPLKKGTTKEELQPWEDWLSWLEESGEPEGYAEAFSRWQDSLKQSHSAWFTATATSRLLVGHGNASPTGVGLTLHHTWGVPVIPGSALKGVLAGYVRAVFDAAEVEETCRRLFGAPGVEGTDPQGNAGEVIFHDALWVSRRRGAEQGQPLLARDVLTVHQKTWYGGKDGAWPSDYDSPNPVAFLTVRPESRFLVALSLVPGAGPDGERLLRWAADRLSEALRDWGVGGKTAAGYGRLEREGEVKAVMPVARRSPVVEEFLAWLAEQGREKTAHKQVLDLFESEWLERLRTLSEPERGECRKEMRALVKKSPKHEARRDALLERLMAPAGPSHDRR